MSSVEESKATVSVSASPSTNTSVPTNQIKSSAPTPQKSVVLSTPTKNGSKEKNSDKPTLPPRRRSKRVLDQDPIIAPGYGTQKDLVRLTQELNRAATKPLPREVVEAVMRSRGRGLRGSKDGEEEAKATPVSSAWADFMKEEGVGGGDNKRKSPPEEETPGRRSKRGGSKKDDSQQDSKPSATDSDEREYILPEAWQQLESGKKASKKKAVAAGLLLQAGTLDCKLTGRSKFKLESSPYHCPTPSRIGSLASIPIQKVFTSCNAVHSFALAKDGTTYAWGRNESQQLGLNADDAPKNVYTPTELELAAPLVMAACGKSHSVFLLEDASVYAVGANKSGQCSVRNYADLVPNLRKCAMPDGVTMAQIACGEDFTMAISTAGHLYSCGSSQYGQLGNGETGEYFITANKLAFANCNAFERRSTFCHAPQEKLHANNEIAKVVPLTSVQDILVQQVSCGKHHTLVVEAATSASHRPRVFSFGCGDYGCLGHGVQKDDYYPRLIGVIPKLPMGKDVQFTVTAGAHCSLLRNNSTGHVYYWGKHKSAGEAVMRPQLVDVLANNSHVVTQMAAGGQTVICSTNMAQTVAWGQGPNGELGLGKAKSSSKPTFVESLNGISVVDVAAGYGHSLYVVLSEKAEDEKAVNGLAKVEEEDLEPLQET